MRKLAKLVLLTLSLVLLAGSLFTFTACGDKTSAEVKEVISAIEELPSVEEISLTDRRAVQNARSDYNALKNADKEQVTNLDRLVALEEQVKILLAIDGLTLSFVSDSAMLVEDIYTPQITGHIYNQIETTVVYALKDAGATGAVLADGKVTVTDCGSFTIEATVSYKGCNIAKTAEWNVEVGVAVSGTVSFAEWLNAGNDYTGVTVTIGEHTVPVNADGTWTSVSQYGNREIIVESPCYVAKSREVTVSEGQTELGNFELALYKVENTTGSGFIAYDWENQGYQTQVRGQFNTVFSGMKVPAGESFMFSIEVFETTAGTGNRFGASFLGAGENNGIGLLFFTHTANARFQYFNPVTSYTDAHDASIAGFVKGEMIPLPAGPMKLTYYRIKDGETFRWYTAVEIDGKKHMSEVDVEGGKKALSGLDAQEIIIGVGGPDLYDGNNVTWKNPTLIVGDTADDFMKYTATVTLDRDESDNDSTAVLSSEAFVFGNEVTLTVTPKAKEGAAAYVITEATLNGADILAELVDHRNGQFTYQINYTSDYPDHKLEFYIKIERVMDLETPVIVGPEKVAYTTEHKEQVLYFDITGLGTIDVSMEADQSAANYITWDSEHDCLNIADGLSKGTYTVTLTADNGAEAGPAVHTLKIYVESPYTDSALEANELGVFDSDEYLRNAANDRAWNHFAVATELVEDDRAADGKALKVVNANTSVNNYVILYFARQDILRSQVKSVSVRMRGENLNTAGNAVWIRCGENPQQTFPASTFVSGEYVTITISNLAVLNAMAVDGYMSKMFIHFAGPVANPAAIYIDEITFVGDLYGDEALKGTNTLINFSEASLQNVVSEGHWNSNVFPVNSEIYNDEANGNSSVLKVTKQTATHGFVQIYFAQAGVLRENVASITITLRTEGITGLNVRTGEANSEGLRVDSTSDGYITVTVTNSATLNSMAVNGVMTALGLHFMGGENAAIYVSSIAYTSAV